MEPRDIIGPLIILLLIIVVVVIIITYYPKLQAKTGGISEEIGEIAKEEWGITEEEQYKKGIENVFNSLTGLVEECDKTGEEKCFCKRTDFGKLPTDTGIFIANEDGQSKITIINTKTNAIESEMITKDGGIGIIALGNDNKLYCIYLSQTVINYNELNALASLDMLKIKDNEFCIKKDKQNIERDKMLPLQNNLLAKELIAETQCNYIFQWADKECVQGIINELGVCGMK